MIGRKNSSKTDRLRCVEQIIGYLSQAELNKESDAYKLKLKSIFEDQRLDEYFIDIWKYLSAENIEYFKRYECLGDGLYILLKGEINYIAIQASKQIESERKKLKTANNRGFQCNTIISEPFYVFTCSGRNCSSVENSVLLRIHQDQMMQSSFYEFFNLKNQLYLKHYLTTDHMKLFPFTKTSQIFQTNSNLHSAFRLKVFIFRNIIKLPFVGIVSKGKIKLKEKFQTFQFQKYGTLLPNLSYQVVSSEAQVLIIENHQSVIFVDDYLPKEEYQQVITFPNYKKTLQKNKSILNKGYSQQIARKDQVATFSKRELIKRQRDVAKLSKESEQYSIISTYLCHKSLEFAKKQNIKNQTKAKREQRYKNPLILFKVTNSKSKISIPSFCQSQHQNKENQKLKLNTFHEDTKKMLSTQPSDIILKRMKMDPIEYEKMIKKHQRFTTDNEKMLQNKVTKTVKSTYRRELLNPLQKMKCHNTTMQKLFKEMTF